MPAPFTPQESITWGASLSDPTNITVNFLANGASAGGYTSEGFSAYEIAQFTAVFDVISAYANVTFSITNTVSATFQLVMDDNEVNGAFDGSMNPPGETDAGVGVFDGLNIDRGPGSALDIGGYGFMVVVHEVMHGMGLAHPHDTGGGSSIMDGVTGPFDSYGDFNLNQGVYTVMTYNNGYHTGAPGSLPLEDGLYGYEAGPMALDIAVLQAKYGANLNTGTGDNVYIVPEVNGAGTYWNSIWDAGGTDEIRYNGSGNVTIDLRAATLQYEAGGGGFISTADGIAGGFTIANGVVIENATGGSGNDTITGNSTANEISGGGGTDQVLAGAGNDTLDGGDGNDTLDGEADADTFYISAGSDELYGGAGIDHYDATGAGSLDGEVITVIVNQGGNGTVTKSNDGGTDTFTSIETFTADETAGTDAITIQGNLTNAGQVVGVANTAVGVFTPTVGAPVAFGGGGQPTIADILAGGNGGPDGTYQITSGEEDGAIFGNISVANFETITFSLCFAAGTGIATPQGDIAVETLCIGDVVRTASGQTAAVKWIGRQTVSKLRSGARMQPVRIRAGALGDGLPHSDLTVTADHGMIIDGLVINASALVNGGSIDWVPMAELPDLVTYYHIETEAHDVILANGAPAETFVDIPGRMAFDNYGEYLELYGVERIIREMDRPRIASQRLLPEAIKVRLGIGTESLDFELAMAG